MALYDDIDLKSAQNISWWAGVVTGLLSAGFLCWFYEFISGVSVWDAMNLLP